MRKEEKIFVIISAACTVFIITGSGQCSSEKAVQLSEELENGEYQGQSVLELGYLIGKDWRRQGFAREAVSMTERFAAEVLQADSLHAFIHPQNESSIAFIKAIGYEKLELPGEDGVLVWQKNLQKGRI